LSFPGGSAVKNLSANAGDMGLIPGLKISLGRENSNSLQYSCLGNLMDRGALGGYVCRISKDSDMTWQLNNNSHYSNIIR